ncbi:hypothetical protein [Neobacillus niacini]|uniref:hypothetical protein n=1 Tax=Neobacillus niacini TaxID=86668 RepID=UPI00285DF794|nr:hypothetical protein [Neobacillus niacini]MDR6999851.1 hypothetical protein [Neobacillus niacini]
MNRKQGLQINSGSLAPHRPQQSGLYLGNKIIKGTKSYSAYGGASYTKRSKGGCGCGNKVPKQEGIQNKK